MERRLKHIPSYYRKSKDIYNTRQYRSIKPYRPDTKKETTHKEITARAVIIHNGEVILLYRHKGKEEYYALPGGHLENNETKEECLIREIKEELSINIKIINFLGIVEKKKHLDYIYNCEYLSGKLLLGGEEKEQNNPSNYYEIHKIRLQDIDKIPLYPANLKMIKKALLEGKLI